MENPETKQWKWKHLTPVMIYLLISAACVLVNLICCEIFQETSSPALSFGFLYPLLGGGGAHLLLVILIAEVAESEYYPIFLGLYHAGILSLTVNQITAGFFEVTGNDSSYTCLVAIVGWMLVAAGIIVWLLAVRDVHESRKHRKM